MNQPEKIVKSTGKSGRQDERLGSHDPVVLIFKDGKEIPGMLVNMSSGGMFFQPEEKCPPVKEGDLLSIRMTLYGRASTFSCTIIRWESAGLGLKLNRDDA